MLRCTALASNAAPQVSPSLGQGAARAVFEAPPQVATLAPTPRRFTELVIVPRFAELQAAEQALSLALATVVGGTRPPVSPEMVTCSRRSGYRRTASLFATTHLRTSLCDFSVGRTRSSCWARLCRVRLFPSFGNSGVRTLFQISSSCLGKNGDYLESSKTEIAPPAKLRDLS